MSKPNLHCLAHIATRDFSDVLIAVDFDGTCVTHEFPAVGSDLPGAVDVLTALTSAGAKLMLWTMRSDMQSVIIGSPTEADAAYYLQHAKQWFDDREIPLYGVNGNPQQAGWTTSPKCYAHLYIDDAALGCPLIHDMHIRPYVDWAAVAAMLVQWKP